MGSLFSKPPKAAPPQVKEVAEILEESNKKPQVMKKAAPEESNNNKPQVMRKAPPAPPLNIKTEEIIIGEARRQMGVDCIKHFNFAVTGQTGVGKSSFINGILSLEDNIAAGEVETSQEIRSYGCKKWPSLKLWDIPSAGTTNHPAATYFEDKKLYVFDTILILTSDRFLDVDFQILRSARKFKTPCVFVRTKCDIAVENRAKRDKVNALEASQRFRAEVSRSFREGLANYAAHAGGASSETTPDPPLYFISNIFLQDEDAYTIYDKKTKSVDCSLSSMDEQPLINFLLDAAKKRAS